MILNRHHWFAQDIGWESKNPICYIFKQSKASRHTSIVIAPFSFVALFLSSASSVIVRLNARAWALDK
jgi:hypothetical protein